MVDKGIIICYEAQQAWYYRGHSLKRNKAVRVHELIASVRGGGYCLKMNVRQVSSEQEGF